MKISDFLDRLEGIHHKEKETDSSVKTMIEDVNEELSQYAEFIPVFFYDKENAECIREMYQSLRKPPEGSIICLNMEKSKKVYQEYYDGMNKFIGDITRCYISESGNEEQKETFKTQLERAKSMDHTFIASIFGGENNQKEMVMLTEATKNIEFLVGFMPEIDKIKKECNAIVENVNEDSDELVKESVRLMYESVKEYCYQCIRESVMTFDEINKKIKGIVPKEEKEEFVLF